MSERNGARTAPLEIADRSKPMRLSLVGNLLANYSDPVGSPPCPSTGNSKALPDKVTRTTAEQIAGAFEDFRRLGRLDLSFNHPQEYSSVFKGG